MRSRLVAAAAVIALTMVFMRIAGGIQFGDAGAARLVAAAGWFGVHGDEGIEDFFLVATALTGLLLALAIVAAVRALRR